MALSDLTKVPVNCASTDRVTFIIYRDTLLVSLNAKGNVVFH